MRHRLSDKQVQMARELGLNPDKLGKIDNHKQEAFTLRFFSYIHYLFLRTGREGTLFPPFLLLRFLLLLLDLHFSHNLL